MDGEEFFNNSGTVIFGRTLGDIWGDSGLNLFGSGLCLSSFVFGSLG
jgi:hypothetical protein